MYYIRLTSIDKANNYVFRSYYTAKMKKREGGYFSYYLKNGKPYKKFSIAYKKLKVAESRVFEGANYRKSMKLKLEIVKFYNGGFQSCKNELNKLKLEII